MRQNDSVKLLNEVTTTGAGDAVSKQGAAFTFQATGQVSASTGAASVKVQVSNDGTNYIDAATISLTLGTSTTTDAFVLTAPWKYIRGNVSSISGTDAAVSLIMCFRDERS